MIPGCGKPQRHRRCAHAGGPRRPLRRDRFTSGSRSVQGDLGRPPPGLHRLSETLGRPTWTDARPEPLTCDRGHRAAPRNQPSVPVVTPPPEELSQRDPSRPNRTGPAVPGCLSRPAGLRHRGARPGSLLSGRAHPPSPERVVGAPCDPDASRPGQSLGSRPYAARTVRRQYLCNPPDLNARPHITCERSMNAVPSWLP